MRGPNIVRIDFSITDRACEVIILSLFELFFGDFFSISFKLLPLCLKENYDELSFKSIARVDYYRFLHDRPCEWTEEVFWDLQSIRHQVSSVFFVIVAHLAEI